MRRREERDGRRRERGRGERDGRKKKGKRKLASSSSFSSLVWVTLKRKLEAFGFWGFQ